LKLHLTEKDALLVVDVQVDFLPGGSLPVANGESILQPLNRYIQMFSLRGLPIIFIRDWHCHNHCSFRKNGGLWPPHCVADTPGALFHPQMLMPSGNRHIVSKGQQANKDAYSGFQDTDLLKLLQKLEIRRVFVCGVATEYCVRATVIDALEAGFTTVLLKDAIQGIKIKSGDADKAVEEMMDGGAFVSSNDWVSTDDQELKSIGDYFISTNISLLDLDAILRFISEESYWGKGRTAEIMHRAIENSTICFGLYQETETGPAQVGFCRVISDLTVFAYLSDVFVLKEHRGKGLGKWLIRTICEHPNLRDLKNVCLITRTPPFYEALSFAVLPPTDVRKFMMQSKVASLPPDNIPS
jgi:nicotinamidase/pyrazinamidase